MRIRVPMTDTRMLPRQPNRLEKKANTAARYPADDATTHPTADGLETSATPL